MATILHELGSDLRHAARTLRRAPVHTLAVVLTLALGMAAVTAVFTVVNAALLAPLPYEEPEELMILWETGLEREESTTVSEANLLDWRERSTTLEQVGGFNVSLPTLTGDGDPERLSGAWVTPNFFGLLGVEPALGPGFAPEHGVPGNNRVAVISWGLWQRRYGADPGIVGRTILVDGIAHEVVGVMGRDFVHPEPHRFDAAQIWRPLAFAEPNRGGRYLRGIGRLAPGRTPEEGDAELVAIAGQLREEYPDANGNRSAMAVPLRDALLGHEGRMSHAPAPPVRQLLMMLGAAGFLLLIVCTNVANLMVARGQQRQGEMAVRKALGADRWRLARQVLAESAVLTALGAVAGLVLVGGGSSLLAALQGRLFPALPGVVVDLRVLGFTLLTGAAAGLLFGLPPALQISGGDLRSAMADSSRSGTSRTSRRARSALVVAEIALATVLVVGAGLLGRSYLLLRSVPTGIDPGGVLVFEVFTPSDHYPDGPRVVAFYEELMGRLRALPGVEAADMISDLPFTTMNYGTHYRVETTTAARASDLPGAEYHTVGADHFRTLGIPLVAGSGFEGRDDPDGPQVVVVSETLAERHWAGSGVVGQWIQLGESPEAPRATIVGVAADALDDGYAAEAEPLIYRSFRQFPSRRMSVLVRAVPAPGGATPDPRTLLPAVRRVVGELDPAIPVAAVVDLAGLMTETLAGQRLGVRLLGLFTALALLLASIGIYGVMAFGVASRRREIAIRTALGAHRGRLVSMVLLGSLKLTAAGVGLGLLGGLALGRVLAALLHGVGPTDPVTFAGAAVVLGAVALLASWLPARRAARLDPMIALRQ